MPSFNLSRWLRSVFFGGNRAKPRPAQRSSQKPLNRRVMVEALEDRYAPATFTWNGAGANNNWSTGANWIGGVAPSTTNFDDLIFPAGAARLASNNDFTNAQFKSITLSGSGYTLAGKEITLGNSTAGTGTIIAKNPTGTSNTISLPVLMNGAAGNKQFFTVTSTGVNLTMSGKIRGTTGVELTKDGNGTLILSADNSGFTGPITITAGAVNAQNATALGSTAGVTTVQSNAQLQLQSVVGTINENLIINGAGIGNNGAILNVAGNNTLGGTIRMDSFSTLGTNSGTTLTVNGTISDLGAGQNLTKEGQGTLVLAHANTYRGETFLKHGTTIVRDPNALGTSGSNTNDTIVSTDLLGSASLVLDNQDPTRTGFTVLNEILTLNGNGFGGVGSLNNQNGSNTWAGTVNLGSAAPAGANVSIGVTNVASPLTISGVVQDPNGIFTLTKILTGTLILTHANTYRGDTFVSAGILNVRDSNALGTTAGTTDVTAGATLQLEVDNIPDSVTGNTTGMNFTETLTFDGTGVVGASGTGIGALDSKSGINQWNTGIQMTGFTEAAIGVEADATQTATDDYYTNDDSLTINGVISDSSFFFLALSQLDKVGAGHLILTQANTYSGKTSIQQGWVTITNDHAFGFTSASLGGDTAQSGTEILEGAALHLKAPTPGGSLHVDENFTITGTGMAHPDPKINFEGAIESIGGDNYIGSLNSVGGNIYLSNTATAPSAGIGVELVNPAGAPATYSHLTTYGSISATIASIVGINRDASGGGIAEDRYIVDTKSNSGTIVVDYDFYSVPDSMHIYYNGVRIFDTGVVPGAARITVPYGPGPSTQVQLVMNEGSTGNPGTAWTYNAYIIPNAPTTSTSMIKLGSKRWEIDGPGTYSGDFDIKEGVVRMKNDTAVGADGGKTKVEAGTALEIDQTVAQEAGGLVRGIQVSSGENLVLNGTGNTTADGTLIQPLTILSGDQLWRGTITLNNDQTIVVPTNSRLLVTGAIGGNFGITKTGQGVLALSAINTFTGQMNVAQGVLNVQNSGALGTTDGTAATGTVVANGASLQLQGNIVVGGEKLTIQGSGATGSTISPQWFASGPAPALNGQTPGGFSTTGPVTGVTVDYSDSNVIYITTADGGSWRTIDNGATWQPMFDDAYTSSPAGNYSITQQTMFSGQIAISQYDPRIIYMATGNMATGNSVDALNHNYGRGVYKSVDSGRTWTLVTTPVGMVTAGNENPFSQVGINRLILDPTDPSSNRLFVATAPSAANGLVRGGVFRYTTAQGWYNLTGSTPGLASSPTSAVRIAGGAVTPGPDEDLAMSFAPTASANFSDVVVDSFSGEVFIALSNEGAANTVYHSSNASFSNQPNWYLKAGVTAAGGGAGIIPNGVNTPARNPTNNVIRLAESFGVIYATISSIAVPPTLPATGSIYEIYRTLDDGLTWTKLTTPPDYLAGTANTFDAIAVDPYDSDHVVIGGQSIYESTNGGTTWTNISTDASGHGPQTGIYYLNIDTFGRIMAGSAGGIFSYDTFVSSPSWTDINGNLGATQLKTVNVSPSDPNSMVGAGFLTGTVLETAGAWKVANTGVSVAAGYDPFDPNFLYAIRGTLASPTAGNFQRSSDGGTTWVNTQAGISAMAIDQVAVGRLLAGGNSLFESQNRGNTYVNLGLPGGANLVGLGLAQYQGAYQADPSFSLATDKGSSAYDPDTIYALRPTQLYVTKDHGTTWVNRAAGIVPTNSFSSIAVDPRDENNIYVTRSAFGGHQVWNSKDGGQTWTDITTNLPDIPVNTITLDPRNGDLYVGNDNGVFRSTDGGGSWSSFSVGLPNTRINDLDLNTNFNILTAATFGRGAYTLWLDPSQNAAAPVTAAFLGVSGNSQWTGPVTILGDITIGASGLQNVPSDTLNSSLTILGVIDDGAGTFNLTKVGKGDVILGGANTYDGSTFINEGVLVAQNSFALGSAVGDTFVADGTALELADNIASETLHLKGQGFVLNGHNSGALRNVSNFNTYGGTIILDTVNPAITSDVTIGVDSGSQLTVTGTITDGAKTLNLIKELTGTLVLANANTYDGTTTVVNGALQVANGGALGTTGQGTSVYDGAQLQLSGGVTVNNEALSLSGSGIFNTGALLNVSGNNTWNGPVILTAIPNFSPTTTPSAQIAIGVQNSTDDLTISGPISQTAANGLASFGIRKVLPGTLTLSGSNTYSDLTQVEVGTLNVQNNNALGTTSSPTFVYDGAALQLQKNVTVTGETLHLNGMGPTGAGALENLADNNTWSGPILLDTTSAIGSTAGQMTIINGVTNAISGPATSDLDKVGPSTVVLAGPNSYAGHTYVENGILNIRNAGALGASGTSANGTSVLDGGSLQLQGSITVSGEKLEIAGNGAPANGALDSASGDNTWTGTVTMTDDASIGSDTAGSTLFLPGAMDDGGNGFDVTKFGAGIVQYSGSAANTYTGMTTVNDGLLQLNKTGAQPFGGDLTIGDTIGVGSSAVVQNLQANEIPDTSAVTILNDGAFFANSLAETLGSVTMVDGKIVTGNGGNLTINSLTMVGGTIDMGTTGTSLKLGGNVTATSSSTQPATIQSTGATLGFNGANRTFTVNAGLMTTDLLLDAPIVGSNNFTKDGDGLMQVKSDNIASGYTGTAATANGTLQVDGKLGPITLAGGTLAGAGTVGKVDPSSFGTINPGDNTGGHNTGTLSTTGSVTLNPASSFHVDLFTSVTDQDLLQVNGDINLVGATLTGTVDPNIPLNTTFTIITTTGGSVVGKFAEPFSPNTVFLAGQKFLVTYNTNSVVLTKAKNDVTLVVTSSINPSVYGQPVTFTVSITAEPGAAQVPDGSTVNISESGTGPAFSNVSLIVTGGKATYTPDASNSGLLNTGSHTITATFLATGNYNFASSTPITQTVNKSDTSIVVSSLPASPVFGQQVTVRAQVTPVAPGAGVPTGTVTFSIDGGPDSSAVNLDLSGGANFALPINLSVGNHTVSATYSSDSNFNKSNNTSLPAVVVVSKDASTTTITPNPSTSALNTNVTFTVVVTASPPGSGTPTGTITILDGATPISTGPLSSGVYTFTTSALSGGSHSIKANYAGDGNFNASTQTITYVVTPGADTISLVSSGSPSQLGSPVTFTATVSSAVSSPYAPGGTVVFYVDGSPVTGNVPLNGARQATFTTSTLTSGNHNILVHYNGDANFAANDQTLLQSVGQASTTVSVASSSSSGSVYGQNVNFTATVSPNLPATATPTGSVTFTVDNVNPTTINLVGGAAVLSIGNLTPGTHTIIAVYNGDPNYFSGSFGFVSQTVTKGTVNNTPPTSTINPSAYGQLVTFTATVTPTFSGGVTPTGTVTFFTNGVQQGLPQTLDAGGKASISLNNIPVGSVAVTYQYSGDSNYLTVTSSALTQTVNKAGTTTTLATTNSNVIYGNETITAAVGSNVPGGPVPTGTVTFTLIKGGVSTTQTIALVGGVATLPHPGVGNYTIFATYNGDSNYSTSTSGFLTQNVTQANSFTAVTANPPTPGGFGGNVTFSATVTSSNSPVVPAGQVVFTVDSVNQAPVTLNGSGVATFSTSGLGVGDHNIIANYTDPAGNFANSFQSIVYHVNAGATSVNLTQSPSDTTVLGQTFTVTATVVPVAPAGGTPTGTVTFNVDGTNQAPVTMVGGVATYSSNTLPLGSHHIIATYNPGTSTYTASAAAVDQTIITADTTLTLASSASSAIYSRPVTITATVVPTSPATTAAGSPVGVVRFFVDGSQKPDVTLSGSTAALALSTSLAVGTHTITAQFISTDANFNNSNVGSFTQTFTTAATTTTLGAVPNPSVFFQSVTFTATVTANSPATLTPNGTVTFYDGATPISGNVALNGSGVATFTISNLSVANHPISVVYTPANTNFATSTSATVTQVVNKAGAGVAVTSNANPSTFSATTVTASVTAPSGAPTATGTVTFDVTGATTASGVVVTMVGGIATLPTVLNAGVNNIVATYSGDGNYTSSVSSSFAQTVNKAGTTAAITSSLSGGSVFGQSVTFTATIAKVSPATSTPTGSVVFSINGTNQPAVNLNGSGVASITVSNLPVSATNNVTVTYATTTNFLASSASLTQAVAKASTTTVIGANPNPSVVGQSVTYTATVTTVSPGSGIPGGTVTFTIDGVAQPAVTVDGSGKTAITTSYSTTGNHTVTAAYSGSGSFNSSSSTTTNQTVNANPVAFSVVPASVVSGANFQIKVNYLQTNSTAVDTTFNGPITLALNSGPAAVTAQTVNAVNGVATFTLNIAKAGAYTFKANATGLPAVTSGAVNITASALTGTGNTYTPSANNPVSVSITARDATGGIASNFNGTVTATIVSGPVGATLSGNTVNIVNGSGVMSALRFSKAGSYTIKFSGNGLSFTLNYAVSGRLT